MYKESMHNTDAGITRGPDDFFVRAEKKVKYSFTHRINKTDSTVMRTYNHSHER